MSSGFPLEANGVARSALFFSRSRSRQHGKKCAAATRSTKKTGDGAPGRVLSHLLPLVSYCFMFLMKWIFLVCRGRGEPPERFRVLEKKVGNQDLKEQRKGHISLTAIPNGRERGFGPSQGAPLFGTRRTIAYRDPRVSFSLIFGQINCPLESFLVPKRSVG